MKRTTMPGSPSTGDVDVSIIICTRNRSRSLEAALEKMRALDVPKATKAELVIVDNGSTDDTRSVVERFHCAALPARYVFEPRKGKGYAYEAGVAAAKGVALLLTDDDVHVPANWITGMTTPILEGRVDAVQGGIKIAPHLERPWLRGMLRVWVAEVTNPEHAPEGLVGANMAVSRKAVEAVGGFDHRLGPGAAGFFDDTVLGWEIQRLGYKIEYRPEVQVEHHFDADRLTYRAFADIAERSAHSTAIVMRDRVEDVRPPLSALIKELPGFAVRSVTQAVRLIFRQEPDAGFLARYYRVRLWIELRRG